MFTRPEDDIAQGGVVDEECEEDICKCGLSDQKKIVARHIRREVLGDVVDEVFVSVPSKHRKLQSQGPCEGRVYSNPCDDVQTRLADARDGV